MKIIPKLLSGGEFSQFFTTFVPSTSQTSGRRTAIQKSDSSSDSDKGKLTEKDLFNMIKDINGLPNEMKDIVDDLKFSLEINELAGRDVKDIATTYLNALYKMKVATLNKDKYDNAVKIATDNGAWNEAAITGDGKLIVKDADNNIGYITATQYLENKSNFELLTNSDIAKYRSLLTGFKYDQTVFDTLTNGIGYESFLKLVDTVKTQLGSLEYTTSGFPVRQAQKGLQLLENMSEEERDKVLDSISADTSEGYTINTNTLQIKQLVNYIAQVLPKRAKVWASLLTEIPDEYEATIKLVSDYLGSRNRTVYRFKLNHGKSGSKSEGTSSKSEITEVKNLKLNTPAIFLQGRGQKSKFVINPGTSSALVVNSNTMPLTDGTGKQLGAMCSLQEVSKGEYGSILEWNKSTMGGKHIRPEYLNQVLIEDGLVYSIDMPLNSNGTPNFNLGFNREKAFNELESLGINVLDTESVKNNVDTINSIMEKYSLPAIYDNNGQLLVGNWGRFAVMNGVAFDKTLGIDLMESSGNLLQEVEDDMTVDGVRSLLEDKLNTKYKIDKNDWGFLEGEYDALYKGTIWIPIKVDYFNALTGSEITVPQSTALETIQQKVLRENDILRRYLEAKKI